MKTSLDNLINAFNEADKKVNNIVKLLGDCVVLYNSAPEEFEKELKEIEDIKVIYYKRLSLIKEVNAALQSKNGIPIDKLETINGMGAKIIDMIGNTLNPDEII